MEELLKEMKEYVASQGGYKYIVEDNQCIQKET